MSASTARKGILAGGNWIVDQVKMVDCWPARETLANISSQSEGAGGSPYNIVLNLRKMGAKFPLAGAGRVGKDGFGKYILNDLKQHKIDASNINVSPKAPTSYTDVMTEEDTGRRTFFHCRGANALWDGKGLDFRKSKARIFHLGYLLLLDAIDAPDKKHGTRGAALLAAARKAGMKTSIDCVSEDSNRFKKVVTPVLAHTDYCIVNEYEAGMTTGFKIRRDNGELDTVAMRHAAGALLQLGVGELVVVHAPEGGFARTRGGQGHWQSSLKLPQKYIKGAAGAGDAFCTGMLLGIHEDWDIQRCLFTAVCAAAANLADPTCTGGMKSLQSVLALGKKYKPRAALMEE